MSFLRSQFSGRAARVMAVVTAVALAMPLGGNLMFGQSMDSATVYAAEASGITFTNNSSGDNMISLTEKRTFTAEFNWKGTLSAKQIDTLVKENKLQWSLEREKGLQDPSMFPYQYLGGKLTDWKVWDAPANEGKNKFFYDIKTTQTKDKATVTFSNELMYGVTGAGAGNYDNYEILSNRILDYVGPYTLSCKDSKGNVLGSTTVYVNQYDSFRTYGQIQQELDKIATSANKNGLYAKVDTFGKTSLGYDMKVIFIADSKQTLTDYQALKKKAEISPSELISQVKSGSLKYKVPILYSNIHSDETPGSDSNMDFMWDLVNSKDGKITYSVVTGFTEEGKARLELEKKQKGVVWSELVKDDVTGLGFIRGVDETYLDPYGCEDAPIADLEKYYTVEDVTVDVKELLSEVFFIVVPAENVDAKMINVRENGNGFDLNRDNTFQTQTETQAMTALIADWNPITFIELHGYVAGLQIEPCSPPHEPNIEYDLIAKNGLKAGEAFGVAAVANNSMYNSYVMPLRDYLHDNGDGTAKWEAPWDDMSSSYTPQYSMLHGTVAFTIECPVGNEETTKALQYGLINHGKYVMENKDAFFLNQLEGFQRGLDNKDAESIRPWYVDINDKQGAESNVYRPKHSGNNNFFPEYYVIPLDAAGQQDIQSAHEMGQWLERNGVVLKALNKDVTVSGKSYKAGSLVVDMHQAKRNVANAALYDNALIEYWTDLYSEPLTAFPLLRGFDCDVITAAGAFRTSDMSVIDKAPEGKTEVEGTTGTAVIIDNSSIHAVSAVNNLLKNGKSVGYVTEGQNKGDFVTTINNFNSVKDKYVLTAEMIAKQVTAAGISKAPKLYIPGAPSEFTSTESGQPYGVKNYEQNNRYSWDVFAYAQQLGFELVSSPEKADIIIGNQAVGDDELALIKGGKPYVAYTPDTLDVIKELGIGFDWAEGYKSMEDALVKIEYVDASMVTDKYVMEEDYIMYGYGGARITKVPEGAKTLIKVAAEKPLEGFMLAENVKKYMGSVQAFEYDQKGYDITVFANSLTSKGHQQDDYRYAANAIYSKVLGGEYTYMDYNFTDVKASAWYSPYVSFAVKNNLFGGTSSTTFEPNTNMTRGMFVTVLGRIANEDKSSYSNEFADVKTGLWYEKSVAWASEKNIVTGVGNEKFAPNTAVTREQMCLMVVNYAKAQNIELKAVKDVAAFEDAAKISSWATGSVETCQKAGLISGKSDNKFDPKGTATRAEVAVIMKNFVESYMQ